LVFLGKLKKRLGKEEGGRYIGSPMKIGGREVGESLKDGTLFGVMKLREKQD